MLNFLLKPEVMFTIAIILWATAGCFGVMQEAARKHKTNLWILGFLLATPFIPLLASVLKII